MKRFSFLIGIILLLFLLVSCENNVYIDDLIDRNIWRVGDVYFDTANNAIEYVIESTSTSRGVIKTEDPMRIVTLMRPVLAENSDGIADSGYEKYVAGDEYRGSITIPEDFTGDLCIDFNGFRYDFANTSEAFFVINGGDNVYIYNGTSVIFNEASHVPYAIVVDTKTVTIDEHLLDDRRTDPKAISIESSGSLVITSSTIRENTSIEGGFIVNGDLRIEDGVIYIDKIETAESSSFTITGGEIHSPHEYDEIVLPAIDKEEFEKNGGKHEYIHMWNPEPFKEEIVKLPTCTEEGKKIAYYGCTECDAVKSEEVVIEKSDHDHNGAWVVTDTTSHWRICPVCGAEIDKAEHTFSSWTFSVKDRVYYRHCEVCKREETNNHLTHTIVHHPHRDPTCTEDGNEEYWSCSVCEKCFSDGKGENEIEKESIVIEARGHLWSDEWTGDSEYHWKPCTREGCTGQNEKTEHTNEYYYSALTLTEKGTPFLTISHRCNICGRSVSTEHRDENGVFHLTPLDGFSYSYDRGTKTAIITISSPKSHDSRKWYDIDGKPIDQLNPYTEFSFIPDGKYGFRCELIKDNKVVESCYIELTQYSN